MHSVINDPAKAIAQANHHPGRVLISRHRLNHITGEKVSQSEISASWASTNVNTARICPYPIAGGSRCGEKRRRRGALSRYRGWSQVAFVNHGQRVYVVYPVDQITLHPAKTAKITDQYPIADRITADRSNNSALNQPADPRVLPTRPAAYYQIRYKHLIRGRERGRRHRRSGLRLSAHSGA